jgi:hypothetical protein
MDLVAREPVQEIFAKDGGPMSCGPKAVDIRLAVLTQQDNKYAISLSARLRIVSGILSVFAQISFNLSLGCAAFNFRLVPREEC